MSQFSVHSSVTVTEPGVGATAVSHTEQKDIMALQFFFLRLLCELVWHLRDWVTWLFGPVHLELSHC